MGLFDFLAEAVKDFASDLISSPLERGTKKFIELSSETEAYSYLDTMFRFADYDLETIDINETGVITLVKCYYYRSSKAIEHIKKYYEWCSREDSQYSKKINFPTEREYYKSIIKTLNTFINGNVDNVSSDIWADAYIFQHEAKLLKESIEKLL